MCDKFDMNAFRKIIFLNRLQSFAWFHTNNQVIKYWLTWPHIKSFTVSDFPFLTFQQFFHIQPNYLMRNPLISIFWAHYIIHYFPLSIFQVNIAYFSHSKIVPLPVLYLLKNILDFFGQNLSSTRDHWKIAGNKL